MLLVSFFFSCANFSPLFTQFCCVPSKAIGFGMTNKSRATMHAFLVKNTLFKLRNSRNAGSDNKNDLKRTNRHHQHRHRHHHHRQINIYLLSLIVFKSTLTSCYVDAAIVPTVWSIGLMNCLIAVVYLNLLHLHFSRRVVVMRARSDVQVHCWRALHAMLRR